MTVPTSLSHALQQTQQWLKELRDNGDLDDEAAALSALRAVLHQLRDRLTPEEAVDLAAQLPLIVRGIYFEAWRPARTPGKLHTKEEFIGGVAHKLRPHPIAAEAAVRDVGANDRGRELCALGHEALQPPDRPVRRQHGCGCGPRHRRAAAAGSRRCRFTRR
jgi:uncharacterized protein (DUF2267 family)